MTSHLKIACKSLFYIVNISWIKCFVNLYSFNQHRFCISFWNQLIVGLIDLSSAPQLSENIFFFDNFVSSKMDVHELRLISFKKKYKTA